MQVRHRLTRVRTAIGYNAIPIFGDPYLMRKLLDNAEDMADERLVFFADVVKRSQFGRFRNNEDMNRRLRRNVVKRHTEIVFVCDFRGNLFVDNFFENCFFFRHNLSPVF